MRIITWRLAASVLAFAPAMLAQTTGGPVTVTQTYTPGSRLLYAMTLHSEIGSGSGMDSAQIDTSAEVEMQILPGPADGPYQAELRFTRYKTTVHSSADQLAAIEKLATDSDEAATSMSPVKVALGREVKVLARPEDAKFDGAVTILQQLVEGDTLPRQPVAMGDHWSVARTEQLAAVHFPMPQTLDVKVAGLTASTLILQVHSHGGTQIPEDQIPQAKEALSQGLVPSGEMSYSGDSTSTYRLADALLQSTESSNKVVQHFVFTGVKNQTVDQTVTNTGKLTLESVTLPK